MTTLASLLAHTGLPARGLLDGLLHPVTGFDHLLAMVAVGLVAATATDQRTRWVAPGAFVGGMLAGGLLGLLGVAVPAVELTITLSVIVLGAVLLAPRSAGDRSGFAVALATLAVTFGVAHGHAHGAELPESAIPALYVLGFVTATVALHALGVTVGSVLRDRRPVRMATGSGIALLGTALLLGVLTP